MLVATTVIEVGVDVPNATVMVIEHAERFGLAQLHQLRGRVGRGAAASTCLLVSHGRLSDEARARLEVMVATDDGFAIAERDLELRGPGDFFGTRQWGLPGFRAARLIRDRDLLERARAEAVRFAARRRARGPGGAARVPRRRPLGAPLRPGACRLARVTRIITGHAKGRRLQTPAGDATRPTGARVKQTLFDILAPRLRGCRFLDAFAGSGGIGLEALSRGASRVVLVDTARSRGGGAARERGAASRAPAARSASSGRTPCVALPALAAAGERFDVVYVDPPYASDLYEPAIAACEALLAEGGVVVAEHFHKRALPETIGRLARSREVRVGDHRLSFFARSETA